MSILNLIKYHVEKRENAFREEAIEIARNFDSIGDEQLAQYIMGLISESNNRIPQASDFESEFLKPINVKLISPLHLPITIANDIKGLINVIKNRVGINKILLEGFAGTGKTEAVKNIARILDRQLYYVDFDNLIDSKLGQTNKNIAKVFSEISRIPYLEKSIILFDEIDIIALDRISHNDIREMGRATSSMLRELDRLSDLNKEIIIVATTNLYENFDKALSRRFDSIINFNRYSQEDLIEVGISLFLKFNKAFKKNIKDIPLLKKILVATNPLPYPSQLKNIIKTALAFSDENNSYDYLRRIYESLIGTIAEWSCEEMIQQGFTPKEIKNLKISLIQKPKTTKHLKKLSCLVS